MNAPDATGKTPLSVAFEHDNQFYIDLLLYHGAGILCTNREGGLTKAVDPVPEDEMPLDRNVFLTHRIKDVAFYGNALFICTLHYGDRACMILLQLDIDARPALQPLVMVLAQIQALPEYEDLFGYHEEEAWIGAPGAKIVFDHYLLQPYISTVAREVKFRFHAASIWSVSRSAITSGRPDISTRCCAQPELERSSIS